MNGPRCVGSPSKREVIATPLVEWAPFLCLALYYYWYYFAIARLKDGWLDEYNAWQRRDLSAKRYAYVWADGIYLQARLEDESSAFWC